MKISKEQSNKIQILRGLAILAVVFIHNTPQGVVSIWCRPFMNYAVGCFLFLSGMLSNAENWHPWKRIIKILIPYAVWTLINVLIKEYANPTQLPLIYAKRLITGKASVIMYFVFVYCELTLLIPLIDRLARSKWKWFGFVISPVEIIIMRLIPLIMGIEMNKHVSNLLEISCVGWFIYFYLGYLLGNSLLEIKISTPKLIVAEAVAVIIQIAEGYLYYHLGDSDCGQQLKLSAILTGVIFMILAHRFIFADVNPKVAVLRLLGDYSFGIFFSHLVLMTALKKIPNYREVIVFPFNAVIAVLVSCVFVYIGRRILGKFGKYLAL